MPTSLLEFQKPSGRCTTLSVNAIRSIEHRGGLDSYLLTTPDAKLPAEALRLKRRVAKASEKAAGKAA